MNIVYACDDKFAEIMGISMISLFESNKEVPEIKVYVLDGGVGDENREKIFSVGRRYGRVIKFIGASEFLKSEMRQERGSSSTFSRLYLTEFFSPQTEKLLYLDCDIIVLGSLEGLYGTDIEGLYGAGVGDCVSGGHRRAVGLMGESVYVNAGVLLVNLKKWREDKVSDKFDEFAKSYDNVVPYADQGIVNGVLSCKLKELPLKYNCYTALYDFSYDDLRTFRKPSRFYSENEVGEAKDSPVIVHFTTGFLSLRPWIKGCGHPYASVWLKFKGESPWAETPLREDGRSGMKKMLTGIYKLLPGKLAVGIAGIIHAKIKPAVDGRRGRSR